MGELLTDIVQWMSALAPVWVYTVVFVIAYLENVVPPIPGDMIVVFGGYLVGLGKVDFLPVVLLATFGGALGFMSVYYVGKKVGDAVLDTGRLRWLPREQVAKATSWLQKYGHVIIAANRFLSGARSVISLAAGMSDVKSGAAWFFSTLSALVWTTLITYLGYLVGDNWAVVEEYLRTYGLIISGILLLGIGYKLLRFGLRWRQRAQAGKEPVKKPEPPGADASAG